jgi:fructose-bisphosphate aldolase class II
LREADELGILLEIEIGAVGGEEDGIDNRGVDRSRLYTTAADAALVAQQLGLGERGRYLLAATFGNVHGHYAPGHVELRPELLIDLQEAVGAPGFNFVFHGGSGSSAEEIRRAIVGGVVKFNLDTDLQYAFTSAIDEHFRERRHRRAQSVDKRVYDPRGWGRKAEESMAARVVDACAALGSRDRSIARLLA